MSKQKATLPIAALILAYVFWGVNAPMIKLGLESIPIPIFMSIKFLIASLILLPFALHTWKPLSKKHFYLIILSAFISLTLGGLALNIGLSKTDSINAAVIGLLGPLILFVLSVEFLREHFSLKTFLGILIALTGSVIIIGWPGVSNVDSNLTGNLFIVISVLCSVIGTIIIKPLLKKASTYQVTFTSLFFGILPIAAYALSQLHTWDVGSTTTRSMVGLVYGTIGIIAANFLFFYALNRKKVQSVGIYKYLQPVVTVIAAWFLLAEQPSLKFILGAVIVFIGIYLAEVRLPHKLRGYYHSRHA